MQTHRSDRTALPPALRIGIAAAAMLMALSPALAQQPTQKTCSEAQAYCMQLCAASTTPPPPGWTCEKDRCFGLAECLQTGTYKIGTQYGHHTPRRTEFGPYEKR